MKATTSKALVISLLFIFGFALGTMAQNADVQDSLGLPGDNLNLFAVMKLFRESETLEVFEQRLNDQNSKINNLDLNGDSKVDYIRVIDLPSGVNHKIILQIPINEKENQDVAVFLVEKNEEGEVKIQLVGDEALYGKDYVIEPNYSNIEEGTPNPGYEKKNKEKYTDKYGNVTVINHYTYYETARWPCIIYIFTPHYMVWVSPWGWYDYPPYWSAWTPWYWHQYYGYHHGWISYYYKDYRHCHHYRSPVIREHYYKNDRTISKFFIGQEKEGVFRKTYLRPESQKEGTSLFMRDINSINDKKKIRVDDFENKEIKIPQQPTIPEKQREVKDRIRENRGRDERINEKPVQTPPKIQKKDIKIRKPKD